MTLAFPDRACSNVVCDMDIYRFQVSVNLSRAHLVIWRVE